MSFPIQDLYGKTDISMTSLLLLSSLSVVLQDKTMLDVTLDLLSSGVILLKEGVPCLRT